VAIFFDAGGVLVFPNWKRVSAAIHTRPDLCRLIAPVARV